MKLPTHFSIICRANGEPVSDVLVLLIMMRQNSNSHIISTPTDGNGQTVVPWSCIDEQACRNTEGIDTDCPGFDDFAGAVVFRPMGRDEINKALIAYNHFHEYFSYPEGYAGWLITAREKLNEIAPARLTVEVQHDGDDIEVTCERAVA